MALTVAGIVAAAAVTAGSIKAATDSSGAPSGNQGFRQVPLPRWATPIVQHNALLTALNINQHPPSFSEWIQSGGKATFPLIDPGFTPKQFRQLGLVGAHNQPVPFVDIAAQKTLTPEQLLFIREQSASYQKHLKRGR